MFHRYYYSWGKFWESDELGNAQISGKVRYPDMTYHSEQVSDGFSVEKVSCKAYFLSSGHWTASMQPFENEKKFLAHSMEYLPLLLA